MNRLLCIRDWGHFDGLDHLPVDRHRLGLDEAWLFRTLATLPSRTRRSCSESGLALAQTQAGIQPRHRHPEEGGPIRCRELPRPCGLFGRVTVDVWRGMPMAR